MAYLIFNDISEVKDFIGGGANLSIDMDSILPVMHDAARDHLLPWLGKDQWLALVDAVENDDAGTEEEALLPYVRRPLAHLTFYEYSKIGGIQFSESGIFRTETENMKSAYKYQENEYRNYMLTKGYEAIEELLAFLEANEADYALWSVSRAYTRNKALLINDATTFRDCYAGYLSRYTFEILRPIIEDLEIFAILPLIGQDQFDALKTAILEKSLTAEQTALLGHIQKAVASFAVREGSKRLLVRIEGRNVVQTENLEPQSYEKSTSAAGNAISLKLLQQEAWGNRHISYIKKFLDDHLEDYPLYSAWIDEQEAAAAAEAAGDYCYNLEDGTGNWQLENAPGAFNLNGPFDRGTCSANCTCSTCTGSKPVKPVFRL